MTATITVTPGPWTLGAPTRTYSAVDLPAPSVAVPFVTFTTNAPCPTGRTHDVNTEIYLAVLGALITVKVAGALVNAALQQWARNGRGRVAEGTRRNLRNWPPASPEGVDS